MSQDLKPSLMTSKPAMLGEPRLERLPALASCRTVDRARSALPLGVALAAVAAVGAWQYLDMRRHQAEHVAEHAEHGRALLDAAEAVAVRECRGGRVDLRDLALALDEMRNAFGLQWIALQTAEGDPLAHAGEPMPAAAARFRFEKSFEPSRPYARGRGPLRAGNSPLAELPRRVAMVIVLPQGPLATRLADDRERAIITASALAAAMLLVAGTFWLHTRTTGLRTELAESAVRLAGLETLRRLGAGLAHETRNPLGVVRGFAERLASGRVAASEVPRIAKVMVEETDRTVARLDEFMLLSRPAQLRRAPFPLGVLLEELATLVRPDLDSAGATLGLSCDDIELDADRDQMRRLLMNLILNAVHAIGPGGRIEITCERGPRGDRITVADDGVGVPPDLRDTLFEPYVTGRPGGTGLGLSIARRIATEHGYTLRHEPRSPRGTQMILDLRPR